MASPSGRLSNSTTTTLLMSMTLPTACLALTQYGQYVLLKMTTCVGMGRMDKLGGGKMPT